MFEANLPKVLDKPSEEFSQEGMDGRKKRAWREETEGA
jgi:hypothetical protein